MICSANRKSRGQAGLLALTFVRVYLIEENVTTSSSYCALRSTIHTNERLVRCLIVG